jgi:hypothetical protein
MNTPVACSLRVAPSPLQGATPAAWQSQIRGARWLNAQHTVDERPYSC